MRAFLGNIFIPKYVLKLPFIKYFIYIYMKTTSYHLFEQSDNDKICFHTWLCFTYVGVNPIKSTDQLFL